MATSRNNKEMYFHSFYPSSEENGDFSLCVCLIFLKQSLTKAFKTYGEKKSNFGREFFLSFYNSGDDK